MAVGVNSTLTTHLTLTSVVFELFKGLLNGKEYKYLTLTSVVFELFVLNCLL